MSILKEELISFPHKSSSSGVDPRLPIFGFCYFMWYKFTDCSFQFRSDVFPKLVYWSRDIKVGN